jgi:predicted outer membrane repeat protein
MRRHRSSWTKTLAQLGFRGRRPQRGFGVSERRRVGSFEHLEARQMLSITVNTLVDEDDGISTGGISLRDAINEGGAIAFAPELVGGTIRLTHGELLIDQSVTITGPGAELLTIGAQGDSRVIRNTATGVTISGLTITGGGGVDEGAGIKNEGSLTLSGVRVTDNETTWGTYAGGGGIYHDAGSSATSLVIVDSTIDNNRTRYGGGLKTYVDQDTDQVLIANSTFYNNTALDEGDPEVDSDGTGEGGGLYLVSTNGNNGFLLANVTVSGNTSNHSGGVRVAAGRVEISGSTITDNHAVTGVETAQGGGIAVLSGATLELYNSIVSQNTAYQLDDIARYGTISTDSARNIVGEVNSSSFDVGVVNHLNTGDPGLLPLGNYGGLTLTHALKPDSQAIDKGSSSLGTTVSMDPRGVRRVIDNPAVIDAVDGLDIGAVESAGLIVNTLADENDGWNTNGVSLRDALAYAASEGSSTIPFRIEFAPELVGGTIRLNNTALNVTSSVQIVGLGAGLLSIDAHGASRVFNVTDSTSTLHNVEIVGLTIKGGAAGSGVGGGILSAENLTLRGVTLSGNSALTGGGVDSAGDLKVIDSKFENNEAKWGGGLFVRFTAGTAPVAITGSSFDDNAAIASSSYTNSGSGGGLYVQYHASSRPVTVRDSTFSLNTANAGAGASFEWNAAPIALYRTTFEDNTAATSGGGLYSSANDFTIADSLFDSNEATWGAGAFIWGGTENDIIRSTFQNNEATNDYSLTGGGGGGGLYLTGGSSSHPIRITNSTIATNSATGLGGGVAVDYLAHVTLLNDTLTLNENATAAAIYNGGGTLTLKNTIVADNDGIDYDGNGASGNNNLFDAGADSTWGWTIGSVGTVLGTSETASLLSLTMPSGATLYRPDADSAAIDIGSDAAASGLLHDQRGQFNRRLLHDHVDAGAVEANIILDSSDNLLVYATDADDLVYVYHGDIVAVQLPGLPHWIHNSIVASVTVNLLDGNDRFEAIYHHFFALPASNSITVNGGSGHDTIIGGTGDDILDGGAGVDTLIPGEDGDSDSPDAIGVEASAALIDEGDDVEVTLDWDNAGATAGTIDWGDGSTPTAVTSTGGPYTHAYASDSSLEPLGRFAIRVSYTMTSGDLVPSTPSFVVVKSLDLAPPAITSVTGVGQFNHVNITSMISGASTLTGYTYELQRSRSGLEGTWTQDGTIEIPSSSSYSAGFTQGRYYYRLRTVYEEQYSEWSAPLAGTSGGDSDVVLVTAAVSGTPFEQSVTLSWPDEIALHQYPDEISHAIFRKLPSETSWTRIGEVKGIGATSFVDEIESGHEVYEYRVVRDVGAAKGISDGTGIVAVARATATPSHEWRGAIELIIDSRFVVPLEFELARYIEDLTGDGWKVNSHVVDVVSDTIADIKELIVDDYEAGQLTTNDARDDVKSVILVGHIPVPYSGFTAYDIHGNRRHAADVFYGDVDGLWTDDQVSNYPLTMNQDTGNMNLADDGIFDQNTVPSDGDGLGVELSVGRIDMSMLANFDPRADYTAAGGWQTYTIPVGEHYQGTFDAISLVSGDSLRDGTTRTLGTTEFKDIVLRNVTLGSTFFAELEVDESKLQWASASEAPGPYRAGINGYGTASSHNENDGVLSLSGNAWFVASVWNPITDEYEPISISANSSLEVTMRYATSQASGTVQPWTIAIGFDVEAPPLQGRDSNDNLVDITRASGYGPSFEQIQREQTFRLYSAPYKSWGREIDPDLETELLRRYLNKNHAFRSAEWDVRARGLIDGTQPSQDGWRNLTGMLGYEVDGQLQSLDLQTHSFNWREEANVPENSYLWGYGTSSGTFEQLGNPSDEGSLWAPGVMSSEWLSQNASYVVYAAFSGSYLGHWEFADSLLRSHLANSGYGLVSMLPVNNDFSFYHMGSGSTVGDALLTSQNRNLDLASYSPSSIYTGIQGDPTLSLHVVAPPTDVEASTATSGVDVDWTPSSDAQVINYRIYRASVGTDDFELIGVATGATYNDPSGSLSTHEYMVRAMRLQSGPGGSYYNLSQGAFSNGIELIAAINAGGEDPETSLGVDYEIDDGEGYLTEAGDGGTTWSTEEAIDLAMAALGVPAGSNPDLFQSARVDGTLADPMEWDFSVANGRYAVRLGFAEIDPLIDDAGERTFDFQVEDLAVYDFDIVGEAGGQYRGIMRTFIVDVDDGNLDLNFWDDLDLPLVSTIEVYRI